MSVLPASLDGSLQPISAQSLAEWVAIGRLQCEIMKVWLLRMVNLVF